jgi:hypothetical protein
VRTIFEEIEKVTKPFVQNISFILIGCCTAAVGINSDLFNEKLIV